MDAQATSSVLKAALEYAARGWKVLPIHAGGKNPHPKAWQKCATDDEDVIVGWWEQWPDAGVGIKLGQDSGIIDIECDDSEAEKLILALCGGEFPITPTWEGKRGKHRMFRWRADLPNQEKAVFKLGALEFRTGNGDKGAQSVMPPSSHPSGATYRWVIHPEECDYVAEISDVMLARIVNSLGDPEVLKSLATREPSERNRLYEEEEIGEGGRDNVLYKEACNTWREKRIAYGQRAFDDPEIGSRVYKTIWAWNRSMCRPPLEDEVIRQKVESAKAFIQRQIFDERKDSGFSFAQHGLEWRDDEWWPGTWSLTVVLSDPPAYRLIVPDWAEMIGGDGAIHLEAEQYRDPAAVAQAIFSATKTVVVDDMPGRWPAIWNGKQGNKKEGIPPTRGLKAKLMEIAKSEKAPTEWKRGAMVAELLSEKIAKAKSADAPDPRGNAVRMPDGTIWLRWSKAWQDDLLMKRVDQPELRRLARRVGLGPDDSKRFPPRGENRLRYVVLTARHVRTIDEIREADEDGLEGKP